MVVKNEALFIRACIESALSVADEVVVVDTGSTDATLDIARSLGARGFLETWPGDLGRAHNLPLEHARGDWILVLDGDEVLDPTAPQVIPDLCERGSADGYEFTFRNYLFRPQTNWKPCDPLDPLTRGALGWVPSRAVRLFRNDPRYRHEGQVHQRINASIEAAGGRIAGCDMPLHHYGMLRCDRDKTEFYVALTERQAVAANDALSWLELGTALSHTNELAAERRAFKRACDLGLPVEGAFHLARIESNAGNNGNAIAHLESALSTLDGDETMTVHRADILEDLGRNLDAAGRRNEAVTALRYALQIRPDSPVALTELAGLLAEENHVDEAAALVQRLLRRYRGLESTWTTLGNLDAARGQFEAACRSFETALDIDPKSAEARHNVAVTHARAGRRAAAERALSASKTLRNGEALAWQAASPSQHTAQLPKQRSVTHEVPTIASVTDHLYNGPGLVMADIIRALDMDYRHVALVEDRGDLSGMDIHHEMEHEGVEIRSMAWGEDLRRQLEEIRPALGILHWWSGRHDATPVTLRVGDEPWICVGHASLPMPPGFDAYVVLSDFQHQSQGHLPPERIVRIPNAVDLAQFPNGRRGPRRPITVAMLTRFDPDKFPRRLLHYLPPLEELGAQLVIAGRGRRRWEIEPDIEALNLEEVVRFIGPIPWRQVPSFLLGADIGLHLTETVEETMSKTVLEMLAAGLPIISQPRGCLPQLVRSGENGYLADGETEVAARLTELIRSRRLRERMGARSRRIAEHYAMPTFNERWRRLAARVTAEAQRERAVSS